MGLSAPTRGISLCAGAGGLDLGLHLAEPGFRTVCWCENDADAAAAIIAGMVGGGVPGIADAIAGRSGMGAGSEGAFHGSAYQWGTGAFAPAPVWDDVRTFCGTGWRGAADIILAGYPCQPFSTAGSRRGVDDERHLWPDIRRIIRESGVGTVFLENVAGHLSLGFESVLGDLWGMGFTVAAGAFSSAEAGGRHDRLRLFILAYREDRGGRIHPRQGAEGGGAPDTLGRGRKLGHAKCGASELRPNAGNLQGAGAEAESERIAAAGREFGAASDLGKLGNAAFIGSQAGHANKAGRKKGVSGISLNASSDFGAFELPGPNDRDGWRRILILRPDLAPALSLADIASQLEHAAADDQARACAAVESPFRRQVDALAGRARALKLLGNGVDPMVAAHAWRSLAAAAGLRPVDFSAERGGGDSGIPLAGYAR